MRRTPRVARGGGQGAGSGRTAGGKVSILRMEDPIIDEREEADSLEDGTFEKDVKKEKNRLKKVFKEIEEKKKRAAEGLFDEAAFMRISLRMLKDDLQENGFTEMFQQSEKQEPYERERPQAKIYATMNGNYQKIIKQLTDLLPKDAPKPKVGDPFEEF